MEGCIIMNGNFKDYEDYQNQYAQMKHIWATNGFDFDPVDKRPLPKRLSLKDTLALPNATFLIPQVLTEFVREGIEPLLVGPSLLRRIDYKAGMTISFPAIGGMAAADLAPGQEFPEYGPDLAGAEQTEIKISKSGLALKFLDDIIEQDNFGLIRLWVQLAGNALARHKEVKIFNYIDASGVTLYNNATTPATYETPMIGKTTGRNAAGAFNGTLTHDDFFEAVAFGMSQGYVYNTVLMHPLTWSMWVKDPYMRAFALQAGRPDFFQNWTGNRAVKGNNWNDPIQELGPTAPGQNVTYGSELSTMPQWLNTAPQFPSYFPFPMTIIVSPFMPITETTDSYGNKMKLTDIILFDRSNLGALVVKDEIQTAEWKEPFRDVTKMKIWESYAIAILNQGQGIGVLRNIRVDSNQLVLPAQTTLDVSSILATTGWTGFA